MTLKTITIDVHAAGTSSIEALVADVRDGLTRRPKELPPRWFYDDYGSLLFDEITRLPEYYLTRTETAILRRHATEVIRVARPVSIVELGAGTATKTRLLIEAGGRLGPLAWYVPFDLSAATVQDAAEQLVVDFPWLSIHVVVGDFDAHVSRIPRLGPQLVLFLGSTIGNFDEAQRSTFLRSVRGLLQPGDAFLLGVDLVKDEAELVAAYDDAAGVTADFNRNVLVVINRELGADFDLEAFEHVALYNREYDRIEMHLRSTRDQTVAIPPAGIRARFEAGELMRTEISAKFRRPVVEAFFRRAGLALAEWYTDERERFALALGVPV